MSGIGKKIISIIGFIIIVICVLIFICLCLVACGVYIHSSPEEKKGYLAFIIICIIISTLKVALTVLSRLK